MYNYFYKRMRRSYRVFKWRILDNTNDSNDLYKRIALFNKLKNIDVFKRKLIEKSKKYTSEKSAEKNNWCNIKIKWE